MRVLAISLGALLVIGSILTTLRLWGLSLPIVEYQSEFFTEAKPWFALEISTKNEIEQVLQKKSDTILFFNLRMSADHILYVQAPEIFEIAIAQKKFKNEDYKGPKPYDYPFSFLQKEFPGIFSFEEVLQKYPAQRLILNLVDNARDIHTVTVDLLKKYNLGKNLVIHSPVEVVLKSIKNLEPLWLYGTSQAEATRLLSLNSLGVLPAATMRSDVFLIPLKIKDRQVFSESLNEELVRRKKKIMLGPLISWDEFESARKFKVDGFIFRNLVDFEAALGK
ncbi:MAG: hypothetical protein AABY64_01615 [Bdellovibrionota bacterium]